MPRSSASNAAYLVDTLSSTARVGKGRGKDGGSEIGDVLVLLVWQGRESSAGDAV